MRKIIFIIVAALALVYIPANGLCYTASDGTFYVNTPQIFVIYVRLLKFYTGENQTGDEVTVINNPDGVSADVCQTGGAYSVFASGISIPVGTYESYRMICRAKFRMKGVVKEANAQSGDGNWYYTSSTATGNAGGPVTTQSSAASSAEETELTVPSDAPEPDDSGEFTTPVVVTEDGTTNIRFLWNPTNELEVWFPSGGGIVLRPTTPTHEDALPPGVPSGDWGPSSGGQVD